MAPTSSASLFLAAADVISLEKCESTKLQTQSQTTQHYRQQRQIPKSKYHLQIVWRNVIAFVILHSLSVYGLFWALPYAKVYTIGLMLIYSYFGAVGITAGAHRLWAHKCYKAKWPLRLILMFGQTMAFQNHIYEWVRDHRVHHKFTDTDADPHNSKRGFFFSHMGWLMVRKHVDVMDKGKTVDMSDLEQDSIVMWQKKHYLKLVPLLTFVMPTIIPYAFWNEKLSTAFIVAILRYVISLNFTWLVNSAAHIWGMKPYDKTISAAENLPVAALTFGEGFHNYHHAFPWDYKAAELGNYSLNLSTAFIDMFAKIGWAYDMKMATKEMVMKRAKRTGDGSRSEHDGDIWGWDDVDMSAEDRHLVQIINKEKNE
ncbi:hypothetical protein PGB90_002185 [Kerria lacca]|nr:acyl-CoA delta(11) desaturase [Kerria lacca]